MKLTINKITRWATACVILVHISLINGGPYLTFGPELSPALDTKQYFNSNQEASRVKRDVTLSTAEKNVKAPSKPIVTVVSLIINVYLGFKG